MTSFHQQNQKVHTQINIGNITLFLHTTENIVGMMAKAVRLLQTEHYEDAISLLDKVIQSDEEIADAYYYRGLATLKGRRPKSVLKSSAEKIIKDLSAAINLESVHAHYYYLLALVLYDFFLMNGFHVDEAKIASSIRDAENYTVDIPKCNELIRHTNSPNSPVIDILKQRL